MNDVFERLRQDWALSRNDAGAWVISRIVDDIDAGEALSFLAEGPTIEAAIVAAEQEVADQERRDAERRADYERRKAAGQLTPLEIAMERTGGLWVTPVLEAVSFNSVLADRISHDFEKTHDTGETIKVRKWSH